MDLFAILSFPTSHFNFRRGTQLIYSYRGVGVLCRSTLSWESRVFVLLCTLVGLMTRPSVLLLSDNSVGCAFLVRISEDLNFGEGVCVQ